VLDHRGRVVSIEDHIILVHHNNNRPYSCGNEWWIRLPSKCTVSLKIQVWP
jgi:hypothetical protein